MFDLFGWFKKKNPSNNDNIDIPERPADYDDEEDEEEEFDEYEGCEDVEIVDYYFSVYDDNGDDVPCDWCGGQLKHVEDGSYMCVECGRIISREDFFESIGMLDFRPGCLNCRDNFPLCKHDWCYLWQDSEDPNESSWPI